MQLLVTSESEAESNEINDLVARWRWAMRIGSGSTSNGLMSLGLLRLDGLLLENGSMQPAIGWIWGNKKLEWNVTWSLGTWGFEEYIYSDDVMAEDVKGWVLPRGPLGVIFCSYPLILMEANVEAKLVPAICLPFHWSPWFDWEVFSPLYES